MACLDFRQNGEEQAGHLTYIVAVDVLAMGPQLIVLHTKMGVSACSGAVLFKERQKEFMCTAKSLRSRTQAIFRKEKPHLQRQPLILAAEPGKHCFSLCESFQVQGGDYYPRSCS